MSDRTHDSEPIQSLQTSKGRVLYVAPLEGLSGNPGREFDLLDLWNLLWRDRWLVGLVTIGLTLCAVIYALLAREWYRAEVLLAPASQSSALATASPLNALANLAGIGVADGMIAEPIAVLKSRDLAREFIEDEGLMTVLLADAWDKDAQRWKKESPEDQPDIRDAVKYFDEKVRRVEDDTLTGLVTLKIEWTDPQMAAYWANALVDRLNSRMRARAISEATANIEYLQAQLDATSVVTLRQSLAQLLEVEQQRLMLARGNEEFSFRIIDSAEVPKRKSKPRRVLIVALALLSGLVFSAAVVLTRAFARSRRMASALPDGEC